MQAGSCAAACMHCDYSIMSILMVYACMHVSCSSVFSNCILSRGGMARYSVQDVRNGANSTRAWSGMQRWAFTCAHEGVFQPNDRFSALTPHGCAQKIYILMPSNVIRICIWNLDDGLLHACLVFVIDVYFNGFRLHACLSQLCLFELHIVERRHG